jgi:hypothetical protein
MCAAPLGGLAPQVNAAHDGLVLRKGPKMGAGADNAPKGRVLAGSRK